MAEIHKKNDTVLFSCDKELKDEYYAICKKNAVNPHSLLRGFMRRAVKDWKEKSTEDQNNITNTTNTTNITNPNSPDSTNEIE